MKDAFHVKANRTDEDDGRANLETHGSTNGIRGYSSDHLSTVGW